MRVISVLLSLNLELLCPISAQIKCRLKVRVKRLQSKARQDSRKTALNISAFAHRACFLFTENTAGFKRNAIPCCANHICTLTLKLCHYFLGDRFDFLHISFCILWVLSVEKKEKNMDNHWLRSHLNINRSRRVCALLWWQSLVPLYLHVYAWVSYFKHTTGCHSGSIASSALVGLFVMSVPGGDQDDSGASLSKDKTFLALVLLHS